MSHPKRASVLAATLILISLLGRAVPTTFAARSRSALQTREQEQIDAYIHTRMQAAHIPGLALGIVRGKEVVYLKGYGIAGPDGRSVTPQTPFILGSTSKSFTALAVMQLVEAGKIDLDAPVTKYLPWFRTADAAALARITVRNLLHQDSGLPVDAAVKDSRKTTRATPRWRTASASWLACSSTMRLARPTNTPTKTTPCWA